MGDLCGSEMVLYDFQGQTNCLLRSIKSLKAVSIWSDLTPRCEYLHRSGPGDCWKQDMIKDKPYHSRDWGCLVTSLFRPRYSKEFEFTASCSRLEDTLNFPNRRKV